MKINKIFLFATLASAMLFTACSDDDDYSGPGEWNATADYANIYFKTTRVDESLDPADPTTATFNVYRRVQHEYTYGKDSLGNDTVSSDKIVTPLPARTVKLDIIENTNDVFKISDATFAEGDTVATVNVTFDGAEIGKTHTLKVTSNDPTLVSYYSKDITFTYNVTRVKWNLLGKGKIVSGYYFPGEAEVEIYQMDSNKNNYRVAHPFDDILAALKADTENWAAEEFNGQQPDFLNWNRKLSEQLDFLKLADILKCIISVAVLRIPLRIEQSLILVKPDIFLSDSDNFFDLINLHFLLLMLIF